MAWDPDVLLTRLRAILQDNAGSVRTVGAGRLSGNLHAALSEGGAGLFAASGARAEARIVSASPADGRFIRSSGTALTNITVRIRVVRKLDSNHLLNDEDRDDLKALVAQDSVVLRHALEWSGAGGNLSNTSLVSGVLTWQGSEFDDVDGPVIESTHTFTGTVRETLPTS